MKLILFSFIISVSVDLHSLQDIYCLIYFRMMLEIPSLLYLPVITNMLLESMDISAFSSVSKKDFISSSVLLSAEHSCEKFLMKVFLFRKVTSGVVIVSLSDLFVSRMVFI